MIKDYERKFIIQSGCGSVLRKSCLGGLGGTIRTSCFYFQYRYFLRSQHKYEEETLIKKPAKLVNNFSESTFVLRSRTFVYHWKELIRASKPTGTYLLLLPCYWGMALGVTTSLQNGISSLSLFAPFIPFDLAALFLGGAFLARSGGCIVNDIWDRNIDGKVERTKTRPLAMRALTVSQAVTLITIHFVLALGVLCCLAPATLLPVFASIPVVVIYPFMKRITYLPQVFLGICFNVGIFVGYAAIVNRLDLCVTLPLYLAAICWTVLYDTIYAYQDKKDDLAVGVKSTAILFGNTKKPLYALEIPIICGCIISGIAVGQGIGYWVGLTASSVYLTKIISNVNINVGPTCAQGFKNNVKFAIMLLFSMFLGNLFLMVHLMALDSNHEDDKEKKKVDLKRIYFWENLHTIRSLVYKE